MRGKSRVFPAIYEYSYNKNIYVILFNFTKTLPCADFTHSFVIAMKRL